MPPKKVAAKGAKGKAKAEDKEQKKVAKLTKELPKGKLLARFVRAPYTVYIVKKNILRISQTHSFNYANSYFKLKPAYKLITYSYRKQKAEAY